MNTQLLHLTFGVQLAQCTGKEGLHMLCSGLSKVDRLEIISLERAMYIQRHKEGKMDATSFEIMKDTLFFSPLAFHPTVAYS